MAFDCQVAVVGAGPAGATAARELALSGHEVLLFDRARFPRFKVCAGALSAGAFELLPAGVSEIIRERLTMFSVVVGAQAVTVEIGSPYAYTVEREQFDHWMVGAAVAEGCDFRQDCRVDAIEQDRSGVTVRCGGRKIRAEAAIRADGSFGYARDRRCGFALETVVERTCLGGRLPPETAVITLGSIPGGYAWAIPRGARVSLGVGVTVLPGRNLRRHLSDWLQSMLPSVSGLRVTGHHLPTATWKHKCSRGRILVAGDAAGLVDPLTGEGIRHALWSGIAAARTVGRFLAGRGRMSDYDEALSAQFWPEMMWAYRLQRLIRRSPRLIEWLIGRRPGTVTSLLRAVAGRGSYRDVFRAAI